MNFVILKLLLVIILLHNIRIYILWFRRKYLNKLQCYFSAKFLMVVGLNRFYLVANVFHH